jgi:hypothetical protein
LSPEIVAERQIYQKYDGRRGRTAANDHDGPERIFPEPLSEAKRSNATI